jgi:NAD-dependent SIR2 family protein deacetylase
MNTALKTDEEKKEYFDSEEELEFKLEQLAFWILESQHFTAFTGAGISTGAGINDFRSGVNTCLDVGPGVWEKQAQNITNFKPKVKVKMHSAFPTKCHMALVKLQDEGILKFIISQNVDGLHRKSGILPEKIAELHGNTNKEVCGKCKKEYMRDFGVRNAQDVHDHKTGRLCDDLNCKGPLNDSIINFKEPLPEKELDLGFYHAQFSDLMLCLGSSLRVNPAAQMPDETVKSGGRIVIVNLQKTPLDDVAAMIIHAKIEDVMERLMAKLNLEIPKWKITRRVSFKLEETKEKKHKLSIKSVEIDGGTFSIFSNIILRNNKKVVEKKKEPFTFEEVLEKKFELEFEFHGHYDEPNLKLDMDRDEINKKMYILTYDPYVRKWVDVVAVDDFE